MSQLKKNLPYSSFRQDLESLKSTNMQLMLLTNCTSSGYPAQGKQPTSSSTIPVDILRRNSAHANDLYYTICDSYRCQCLFPHEANLGLRQDSPKLLDSSESFKFIFPVKEISENMSELDLKSPTSPSDISVAPTADVHMRY